MRMTSIDLLAETGVPPALVSVRVINQEGVTEPAAPATALTPAPRGPHELGTDLRATEAAGERLTPVTFVDAAQAGPSASSLPLAAAVPTNGEAPDSETLFAPDTRTPSPSLASSASTSVVSTTSADKEFKEESRDAVLRAYMVEPPEGGSPLQCTTGKYHSKTPLVGWLRAKVSQNKVRFRDDSYDLDLTYITPRIIAMGYPAHGTEYYIRNPIDRVEDFFATRHPHHFYVYNLCGERHYDGPTRFQGRFKCFPFDDHNAPPLALMCAFVQDAVAFLNADPLNVVAVHCKAGKGRTGLMTCCLLLALYPDQFPTAPDAIRFFDTKRTNDGRALTIPSQQRYVRYFDIMLKKCGGHPPPETRTLALNAIRVDAPALRNVSSTNDLYFTVATHKRILLDSRVVFPNGPAADNAGAGILYTFRDPVPALTGDIKLTFYRRKPFVFSGKESHAFYTWFNTNFCDVDTLLHRNDLDKVDTSAAGKSITLEVFLQPMPYKLDFAF